MVKRFPTSIILLIFIFTSSGLSGADKGEKVLIMGDSHAAALKGVLENVYQSDLLVKVKGVSSSGLVRDDFFNWSEWASEIEEEWDVIFIILGTNDGQDFSTVSPTLFGSLDWEYRYMARIERLLTSLEGKGQIIWVSIPPAPAGELFKKTEYIQLLIEEVCRFHHIENLDFGVRLTENQSDLRSHDGIHLSQKGSEYVVETLFSEIDNLSHYSLIR